MEKIRIPSVVVAAESERDEGTLQDIINSMKNEGDLPSDQTTPANIVDESKEKDGGKTIIPGNTKLAAEEGE